MANFDDLFRLAQFNQNLTKSLGLGSQVADILTQQRVSNNFSGLGMMTEIARNMRHQAAISQNFGAMAAVARATSWQSQFVIPKPTIGVITSINRQHQLLFGNIQSITESWGRYQNAFSQVNNWQFAMAGISNQVAAMAASRSRWDLIDDFEEITEKAAILNDRVFDGDGITTEGLREIKEFLQRIEIRVDKIDTDASATFWKLLTLLGFVLALFGEARNWSSKPEYATKQGVEAVIKEQFNIIERKLIEGRQYKTTRRICKVMLKTKSRTATIESLPKGFVVLVLQIHHKWVYISYSSPSDGLPRTGWIMKKYLDKPE